MLHKFNGPTSEGFVRIRERLREYVKQAGQTMAFVKSVLRKWMDVASARRLRSRQWSHFYANFTTTQGPLRWATRAIKSKLS